MCAARFCQYLLQVQVARIGFEPTQTASFFGITLEGRFPALCGKDPLYHLSGLESVPCYPDPSRECTLRDRALAEWVWDV